MGYLMSLLNQDQIFKLISFNEIIIYNKRCCLTMQKGQTKKKYKRKEQNHEGEKTSQNTGIKYVEKKEIETKPKYEEKYPDKNEKQVKQQKSQPPSRSNLNQKEKEQEGLTIASKASKIPQAPKWMQKKNTNESQNTSEPVRDMIDDSDIRKLKKYFLEVYEKADRVVLRYDTTKPSILYQYLNPKQKETTPLKELLKANENFRKNKDLIRRVYEAIYRQVEEKFYEIGYFGLHEADRRRIRFFDRNFKKNSKDSVVKEYPFYFIIRNEKISFLLMDSAFNCVEFTTDNIQGLKNKEPDYFQKFKQFEKIHLKATNVQQLMVENFGQEEVDSDEQGRAKKIASQKQPSVTDIRRKIQKILDRDIQQFQEQIDKKDQRVTKLVGQNSQQAKTLAEKLADQVMEQQSSLDNFTETRDDVAEKMGLKYSGVQEELKVLKGCLKRMILAEKQLLSKLPIISRKRQIFEKLDKNNLLILEGETGSGKSTQLPQLLCQYYKIFEKQNTLPVLITQPRKLATRSLAERVASQMEEKVHGFVDYQTSLTTKISENAKIIFKMDRLVLDQIKVDPKLSKYCCLVIDQAHERTISIDVILGLIKKLLTLRNDFKIIVTSASMDTQLFRKYFKTEILKVSGRMFPVTEIYEPCEHEKDKTQKIIRVFNSKILDDHERNMRSEYKGHVLVFCSGIDQINELCEYYKKKLNPRVFKVHALHGKLTPDEQREVFTQTQESKIIFTTRIAETSITIDKVKVVIDPGEDRELVYDQRTKVTTLKLQNISQSSAKQRAGRAGRTNEGFCFRLYSEKQKKEFRVNKTPEIQNMALDMVVLRLKSLQIDDIINFPYLSPPSKEGLENSIEVMKMLKCLDDKTQKITTIGQFLVKIPIQPFLARSIVEAMLIQKVIAKKKNIVEFLSMSQNQIDELTQINFVDEVIRILCMVVNASNLFYIRPEDRDKADKTKYQKLADEMGDFFFLRKIYAEFIKLYNSKETQKIKNWTNNHFLSQKTLHQCRELERQISQIIKNFPINDENLSLQIAAAQLKLIESKSVREAILSCLVSSFATNLALHSSNEQIGYTIVSLKIPMQIYGTSTLSLQGISPKWILYYDLYENEKGQMYCKIANSINFQFLKKNANPYVLKKFNVIDAEKFNPYYERKVVKLPSLLFLAIASDYQKRNFDDQKNLAFLQQFSLNFYEDRNEVQFFYQKKMSLFEYGEFIMSSVRKTMNQYLKMVDFRQSKNPEQVIEGYIKQLSLKYTSSLKYNYVGPIYIDLKNGFELVKIDLKTTQHVFRITCSSQASQWIINYCQQFGDYEVYSDTLIFRIIEDTDIAPFKRTLAELITFFKANNIKVSFEQELEDRRKKIPQGKLFIHFWTGEAKKNNIYLDYSGNATWQKQKDKQDWLKLMVDCLKSEKLSEQGRNNKLARCTFAVTKTKKGINCFQRVTNLDEIQLYEILEQYHKQRLFGYHFEMPSYVKKFRQPDLHLGSRTQKQWEDDILELLKKQNVPMEKLVVRVWGKSYYANDKKASNFEKNLKVEWHAQIRSFDTRFLQKVQSKYNKKQEIIGTEKAHFKSQYEQIAAVTTSNAFKALEDEYKDIVQYVTLQNPRLTVQHFQKTSKKLTKYFIKVRCQNREQLLMPSLKIANLFKPKLVPLTAEKFRFLDKLDAGNQILEEIEASYQYKIYFAFERRTYSLKVYCEDYIIKQIIEKLQQKMSKFKRFEKQICYRGKNLNRVKELIEQKIEEIRQNNDKSKFLNYEILFKFRKVRITGDFPTCEAVENGIMKIVNKEKEQCQICCDLFQKPYKLYVCKHEYCWVCLSSYIRETINGSNIDLLKCPECTSPISVYDVQKIMSEDEFNKLCDLQIARYIEKNPKFHGCPSPNCENIFLTEDSKAEKSYECDLCGKWYCFLCKESHKGYTCEDWKYKMDDSSLKKLGIKKCPSCGEGIQKNQGCQHVTCLKCKCHICWNCMRTFKQSKDCYDHLAKSCGGIFANNPQ